MPAPSRQGPQKSSENYELWEGVRQALLGLPEHFKSTLSISGIRATDIFTFGEVLGATIELEVVRTLNQERQAWDPHGKYSRYSFVGQPETFPDVLLQDTAKGQTVMGVELKSWYLLAKEGEPSFRFIVTPQACAPQDLLVVVPWALSYVVAGSPMVFKPFLDLARYAAEYRNYWWKEVRQAEGDSQIESPKNVHPYPKGRDETSDKPLEDKGKNFGRIARIGLMDGYVKTLHDLDLLGIKAAAWREFFKTGGSAFEVSGKQSKLGA